jgi:hypothetical protein
MGKILLSLVVIFAVWVLLGKLGIVSAPPLPTVPGVFSGDSGVSEDGGMVSVRDANLVARYRVTGDLSGDFMVFGGKAMGDQASGHAFVSLMSGSDARSFAATYPDFENCKSDGASEVKAAIRGYTFLGEDASTKRAVQDLPGAGLREIRQRGAHLCAHIEGATVSLVDMKVVETGEDVTSQLPPVFQQLNYAVARSAEPIDCASVLH